MKRGQPKCICSPNCKANAVINNNRKVDSNGDIEFIKLPDKKLINRPYSVIRPSEMQSDEPTLIIASNSGQNLRQKINQSNNNSEAHGVINTTRLSSLLPQNATVARSIEVISHKTFINDIQFISSYGNVVSFILIISFLFFSALKNSSSNRPNLYITIPYVEVMVKHTKMSVN